MKPILFNIDMVRAILEGRKTVTRRAIKYSCPMKPERTLDDFIGTGDPQLLVSCAPYQTGDILWVRETWGVYCKHWWEADIFEYRASFEPENTPYGMTEPPKWRPSIHMPKEAARLFLRVTGVRVERLQDITDYRSEGIQPSEACQECFSVCGGCAPLNSPTGCDNEIETFANLWDSTIKPADLPLYGWEANPWVWVIVFERISKEAAQREEGQDAKSAPSTSKDITTL